MIRDEIVFILISLPFCLGMLGAFLAAKNGGKEKHKFHSSKMSDSIWYGYSVGNQVCILSFVLVGLVVLSMGRDALAEAIGVICVMIMILSIVSMIAGLLLYLPCAFLGYNLYARKRAEEEIAKTQEKMINAIEAKTFSKNQSS